MHIADSGTTARQRAPIPGGPTATVLTPAGMSGQVAVVHLEIPVDGGLPEHSHGASEIVLIPLSGSVELRYEGEARTLTAGMTAHVATGERVSLGNAGSEPASLMVVASPPEFAEHLAAWPSV